MPTTKVVTVLANGVTLTAAAGDTTSPLATLDDGYGAALHVKLTNGGAGPTIVAQVQVQVSADNVEWYDLGGPLKGSTTNSAVSDWGGIPIPIGVEYVQLVSGSNTGQNVTLDSDLTEVTAV